METLLGVLLAAVVLFLLSALVIYIVGRVGIGMEVEGFGPAIIAAIVIAILTAIVDWVLGLVGITPDRTTLLGAVGALLWTAVILMVSGNLISGLRVKGFGGAVVAAIAIGVVRLIIGFIVNLIL